VDVRCNVQILQDHSKHRTSLWDKVTKTGQYMASLLILRKRPQLESIMAMCCQTLYDDPYLFTD
jgi:hypothetical protein